MTALRISISFLVSVVIASGWLIISGRSAAVPVNGDYPASARSSGGLIAFPDDVRLCSRLAPATPAIEMQGRKRPFAGSVYRETNARDLPGIVKLEPEKDLPGFEMSKGHCSATRIATNWFVTAAHCVSNGYDRINLKTGSDVLSSTDVLTVPVDFALCHTGFTGRNSFFDNDLSLLYVSDNHLMALSSVPVVSWGVTRVPFSTVRFREARVGGWGLTSFGGELSDQLQKMSLDIMYINDRTIRLMSRAGRGPCIGDSGGPLIVEDDGKPVLMGVLSTISANTDGEMCAGSYLSNYTNLSGYQSWVLNTMLTCNADTEVCRKGPT